MCGDVSDLEFLAVRRAEGADVCHSFLVRLDRRGRVCQRNIQEVHVKGRSIALFVRFVTHKRHRQVDCNFSLRLMKET